MTRWRMVALLALAELLGMSAWFTASALAPELAGRWGLDAARAGWLTSAVQLGFVAGTACAAVLNLADVLPARWYFAAASALAAGANAALLVAPSFAAGLAARFLTGLFLAGVYPPGMKMVATWSREGRGLAIGVLVGALTVGKATPFLVHGLEATGIAPVVLAASACGLVAALLVAVGYRDGPYAFERRPFSWGLVGSVLRHREVRLATGGYLGHMWELYAMWTWLAAFLAASAVARADVAGPAHDAGPVNLLAFAAIAMGGAGCVLGGWAADRIGRERLASWAMLTSGSCALIIGTCYGATWWLLAPVALVWGLSVVADSAQFSALVTELAPSHAVGTALTVQTSLGFLLTMASIQLVPRAAVLVGWQWAFVFLSVGPALGIWAMSRLRAVRARDGG